MSSSSLSATDSRSWAYEDYAPSAHEIHSLVATVIVAIGALVAIIGLLQMPSLGKIHLTSAFAVSIFLIDVIVYLVAIGTGLLVWLASNFGSWEARYSRLWKAKVLAGLAMPVSSIFTLCRMLMIFIHCQRAVDRDHDHHNEGCWGNLDTVRTTIILQFVGSIIIDIGLFWATYKAHTRRLAVILLLETVDRRMAEAQMPLLASDSAADSGIGSDSRAMSSSNL
ncbi:uncharacterized protein AMSG_02431 [Thecamonas trahens ATCC 50062]|uniref:Uncharacterized protein n=1 Tax=Thecamonas trahens ATCC 50062 TaxID=461836 RepID=A0A0L0DY30_THETB|nr:hypothetical protein AMSG_02431 [Thecamonas trahens ATCC 50062]KNC56463.1 hypothetical protein AMSG_02431 [Thecamonas trahens ATCC 50062]|eukprot:XP_013760972.1 hypothetical protein AMSG_02431 [Thecamonas trahens ATCC 50062]